MIASWHLIWLSMLVGVDGLGYNCVSDVIPTSVATVKYLARADSGRGNTYCLFLVRARIVSRSVVH